MLVLWEKAPLCCWKKKKKNHTFQLISFCFKTRDFPSNKDAFFIFFEIMDYDLSWLSSQKNKNHKDFVIRPTSTSRLTQIDAKAKDSEFLVWFHSMLAHPWSKWRIIWKNDCLNSVNYRIFVLELLAYKYNERLHLYRQRVEMRELEYSYNRSHDISITWAFTAVGLWQLGFTLIAWLGP